jgi:tetratricopeptide (TPR) repeat protein
MFQRRLRHSVAKIRSKISPLAISPRGDRFVGFLPDSNKANNVNGSTVLGSLADGQTVLVLTEGAHILNRDYFSESGDGIAFVTARISASMARSITLEQAAKQLEQLTPFVQRNAPDALVREFAESGPAALNGMAWQLATSPDPESRNGSNAVAFAEKAVALTHRNSANFIDTLAAAYAEAGLFDKAVAAQQEALGLARNGPANSEFAMRLTLYQSSLPYRNPASLADRAMSLLRDGKFAAAEPVAREFLAQREKLFPDDWSIFSARSMMGASLLGQLKNAEAEPLLLSAYEGMKQREDKIPAEHRWCLGETATRLVQLYESTGQTQKAAEWRAKLR